MTLLTLSGSGEPVNDLDPRTPQATDRIVISASTGRKAYRASLASIKGPIAYVDDYGAFPNDLVNDSLAAFVFCLANFAVVRWSGSYRLSAGITVPPGCDAGGLAGLPNENAVAGSTLVFDLAVDHCVTIIGDSSNGTANLHDTAVTRAAGAIPSGSLGVFLNTGYNCQIDNVSSTRHAIGFYFLSAGPNGIACKAARLSSAAISDAHLVADTWPELHVIQSRFGANGSVDMACNAYVRITGGGLGGAGPNGVFFTQCQFNQGANAPDYGVDFVNMTHTDSNALEFKWSQCHFEGVAVAIIKSDASCAFLNRLNFTDCTVNCPTTPMLALNAGTEPADWSIHGNQLYVSTFTLAPTVAFSKVAISNNVITATGLLTAPAGSTISLSNNNWNALTIAGAGNFSIVGDRMNAGVFTNSCTGKVTYINPDLSAMTWTPALKFGGASVGLTYSLQVGEYQSVGSYVTASFGLTLTAKGSSTGSATIAGLPVTASASFGSAGGGASAYALNLAGLSSPVTVTSGGGMSSLQLYETGATGVTALTEGNFTDTSSIYGTVTYPI